MLFTKRLNRLSNIVRTLLLSHYTAIKFYEEALSPEITLNDLYTLVTYNTINTPLGIPGKMLATSRIEEDINGRQSLPYTWTVMASQLGCSLSHLRALVSDEPLTKGNICSPALYLRIHNMMGISIKDTAEMWNPDAIFRNYYDSGTGSDPNWWDWYKELNLFRLQFVPRIEINCVSLEEFLSKTAMIKGILAPDKYYLSRAFSVRTNGVRFFDTLECALCFNDNSNLKEFFLKFPEINTPNVMPAELALVDQDMAEIYSTLQHKPGPKNKKYLSERARKG